MARKQRILYGAVVLMASTIMTRLVGLFFRIYLSNTIGAEGMGLFQIIFSFYSLSLTFATSGISTAVSQLVAEQNAMRSRDKIKKIMSTSMLIAFILSSIVAVIVVLFAKPFSIHILKDPRTQLSIYAFAPSLVFISVSACIKGYYYGINDVVKPASSEFIEQFIRMVCIVFLLGISAKRGIGYACAATLLGFTIGELASLLYLSLFYKRSKRKNMNIPASEDIFVGSILKISIPLAISMYASSILRMWENIITLSGLEKYGGSYEKAISTYGVLDGMVIPMLVFPVALLSAISTTIIPQVSEAKIKGNTEGIRHTVSRVLQFTSILGILIVSIFLTFPHELGVAVYNNTEVGNMLWMLAFICPFIYAEVVVYNVLNTIGEQMSTLVYNLLDGILRIFLIYMFVPKYGFNAFLIIMILSNVFTSGLCFIRLSKVTKLDFRWKDWLINPAIAAAATTLNMRVICYFFLFKQFSLKVGLLIGILLSIVIYLIVNYIVGTYSSKDVKYLISSFKVKNKSSIKKR